jgi:hypothetical protein
MRLYAILCKKYAIICLNMQNMLKIFDFMQQNKQHNLKGSQIRAGKQKKISSRHQGLLFKMHNLKVSPKIAKWIKKFLKNREFYVEINKQRSENKKISTGVPQGSILSPILFIMYVNDIPTTTKNYSKNESLLFANDLFSFYSDKNLNRIQIIMQRYLKNLESWFHKWRLKTSGSKCSYNIYQKNNTCKNDLDSFLTKK